MRKVPLIACVSLVLGAGLLPSGSSLAAECTKGMLWPFVRAAGDCLTDAEIAAGQRGVYSGPTNTNVDVSAIKPAEVPAQTGSVSGGGNGRSDGALIETSVFGASAPTRIVPQCHKGILWPFQREPGDCLTEAEKREGQSGVYGGAEAVNQGGAITAAPANTAGSAAQQASSPAKIVAQCNKGILWPFKREPGDCLTESEKREGQTGVYGGGAAVTQASATTAAPAEAGSAAPAQASQPAPQTPGCSRSWLWPFVKNSGDCPSQADKK